MRGSLGKAGPAWHWCGFVEVAGLWAIDGPSQVGMSSGGSWGYRLSSEAKGISFRNEEKGNEWRVSEVRMLVRGGALAVGDGAGGSKGGTDRLITCRKSGGSSEGIDSRSAGVSRS